MNEIYHEMIDENIKELGEKFQKIKKMGWIESIKKGSSSAGVMFESLLGIENNCFSIPDYEGIEIKTKQNKSNYEYITLFSAVPDSYLMEIPRLVETYGYPDKELPDCKILNISVSATKNRIICGRYYFKLVTNYKKKVLYLSVLDIKTRNIDRFTSWSFELLEEYLYRKLKYLAFVSVDRKFEHGIVYFRYSNITFYKLKSFEQFLKLIEYGKIEVGFSIGVYKNGEHKGKINNHGTQFRIRVRNLEHLFTKIKIFR